MLLSKNRDRLSIVAAILDSINSGSSKTRVMRKANLSFRMLSNYLDVVVQSGFVQVDGYKYQLTEQGRAFLKKYKNFNERYYMTKKMLETLENEHQQLSKLCASANQIPCKNNLPIILQKNPA